MTTIIIIIILITITMITVIITIIIIIIIIMQCDYLFISNHGDIHIISNYCKRANTSCLSVYLL